MHGSGGSGVQRDRPFQDASVKTHQQRPQSQTKNNPQKITLEGVGGDSNAAKATSARSSKKE